MQLSYLVHAGIGKEEGGVIVGHHRTRLPEGVVVLVRKERHERIAHPGRRPPVVGEL